MYGSWLLSLRGKTFISNTEKLLLCITIKTYIVHVQKQDSNIIDDAFCSVVFLNHQRFVSLFHDHPQAVCGFTAPWFVMMMIPTWAQVHATHCTLSILVDLSHFWRASVQARFALSSSSLTLKLMVSKLPHKTTLLFTI